MTPSLLRRCAAEVIGTALLVGIGCGAIVAGANAGGVPQVVLAVAWFAAVALPILAFARVSGAHLNPAVTLTFVGTRRFPVSELGPYLGAQVAGAFLGAGVVLLSLGSAAHLGATLPSGGDLVRTFVMELGFTLALLASVLYPCRAGKVPQTWELMLPPAVVGLSTFFIGPFTGSSLNPARTIAPAVLSGDYVGIWVYFLAALVASALCAVASQFLRSRRRVGV